MSRALITGVAGQDGIFLSKFLLAKGYQVFGMVRRKSHFDRAILDTVSNEKSSGEFKLIYGDLEDASGLYRVLYEVQPDEVYNLASQSHVHISFQEPEYTTRINANGVITLLEAIRFLKLNCKFYQACSSELFGDPITVPQNELTAFAPKSPYAIAKLYSYWMTKCYRDTYGMFCSNGIMYNHESQFRGENFVTRKITYSLARIRAGLQEKLLLGNYDAKRDWGFAGDYVEAMWMMLQHPIPDDFVIASGENHSVRDFINAAAECAGFKLVWQGSGVNEIAIDADTGKTIVAVDPKHYRLAEKNLLKGDTSKAHTQLGWQPKMTFAQLVELMVREDMKLLGLNPDFNR